MTIKTGSLKYMDENGQINTVYPKTNVSQVEGIFDEISQIYYGDGADSTYVPINADLLQGKPASYFENLGLHMELLWENAATSLAAQTIPVDMSYKFYLVHITGSADGVECNGVSTIINVPNLIQYVYSAIANSGIGVQSRKCTPTTSGLEFTIGYSARKSESTATNNAYAVPIRIYGIK